MEGEQNVSEKVTEVAVFLCAQEKCDVGLSTEKAIALQWGNTRGQRNPLPFRFERGFFLPKLCFEEHD